MYFKKVYRKKVWKLSGVVGTARGSGPCFVMSVYKAGIEKSAPVLRLSFCFGQSLAGGLYNPSLSVDI